MHLFHIDNTVNLSVFKSTYILMIRFILVFFVIADGRAVSARILHGECLIFSLKYLRQIYYISVNLKKTQRIIQTTKLFGNSSGKKHTQQIT